MRVKNTYLSLVIVYYSGLDGAEALAEALEFLSRCYTLLHLFKGSDCFTVWY